MAFASSFSKARAVALTGALLLGGSLAASAGPAGAQGGQLCNGLTVTLVVPPGGVPFDGTDGNDVILGSNGDDIINGRRGNDTICGLAGQDEIRGAAGVDWINGGGAGDRIFGGDGNDVLFGGDGWDPYVRWQWPRQHGRWVRKRLHPWQRLG